MAATAYSATATESASMRMRTERKTSGCGLAEPQIGDAERDHEHAAQPIGQDFQRQHRNGDDHELEVAERAVGLLYVDEGGDRRQ